MSAASVVRATHDVLATFHKSAQVELQAVCADLVPPLLHGVITVVLSMSCTRLVSGDQLVRYLYSACNVPIVKHWFTNCTSLCSLLAPSVVSFYVH